MTRKSLSGKTMGVGVQGKIRKPNGRRAEDWGRTQLACQQRLKARRKRNHKARPAKGNWHDYRKVLFRAIELLYGLAIYADSADQRTKDVLWSAIPTCPLVTAGKQVPAFEEMADVAQRLANVLIDESGPEDRLADAAGLARRLCALRTDLTDLADFQRDLHPSEESLTTLYSVEFSAGTLMATADALVGFARLNFDHLSKRLERLQQQVQRWREGIIVHDTWRLTAPSYQRRYPW